MRKRSEESELSPEQQRKVIQKKKTAVICAIVLIYLVIVAAAAVIIDDRHVEISLNGSDDETVEVGAPYTDPGAEAYYSGNLFGRTQRPVQITVESDVNSAEIGDYTVKYSAKAFGREAVSYRLVHVRDTTPPVITLHYEDGYKASWLVGYREEGFSAVDNYDGDITERVVRTEADDKVYYSVSDSSGNESAVERSIEYGISEPMIRLEGGEEVSIPASFSFTDPGYEATDESGNDLTAYVQVTGEVTPWVVGSYELNYYIMNEQGETATARRIVNIVPQSVAQTVVPEEKTIYLTFDDGPGPYTGQLLNVLANYGVKATFFVTGNGPEYNDMIGRAYREGHSIGVHSYTHDYSRIYASEQAYFEDFIQMENLIYEQTGEYTTLFRFPGGSSNTVSRNYNRGIMSRLSKYMTDMGFVYFDWNVSSGDAGETTSTYRVGENVKDGCSEHTVCVVLQHDIKEFSVDAVADIIVWGRSHGYTFKALDASSYGAHHGVNN